MGSVYIYEADADDFSTIGICGALTPRKGTFHEVANGMSSIKMEHPMDDMNRYTCLQEDRIIKCDVPVRTTPEIANGQFVTVIEQYTVKNTVTWANRYIYNKADPSAKKQKKLKLLPIGAVVSIVAKYSTDSYRWKCKYSWREKKKKKWINKTTTGYIAHDSNTLAYSESVTVANTSTGIEAVAPSWRIEEQLFRIKKVEKKDNIIYVYANHISYDLMDNMTSYDQDGSKTLQQAADGMLAACFDEHHFTFQTNIQGSKQGFHIRDKDPITALLDPEIGLIPRWNGELIRDNFGLTVLDHAGVNRGTMFTYGKNIKGISVSSDVSAVATAIRPVGESEKGKPIYLARSYLWDGTNTTQLSDTNGIVYGRWHQLNNGVLECLKPHACILPLEGEECKENTKNGPNANTVKTRLLEQAIAKLSGGAESPDVSVDVDMQLLGYTQQWAIYRELEKVFLFDTVRVRHPRLNIDIETPVTEMEWDYLEDKPLKIHTGQINDLSSSVSSWQVNSLNGVKLTKGSVSSGQIGDEAVHTDALAAKSVTANKLAAGAVYAQALEAVQANIQSLTAGRISTDELYASIAQIAAAEIGNVDINHANVKALAAAVAAIADAQIEQADITTAVIQDAQVQTLAAALAKITRADIEAAEVDEALIDWAGIDNLTAQAAAIAKANVGTATISSANIQWAAIKDISAQLADLAQARIDQATITQAQIDELHASVVDTITLTAQNANLDFASAQRLVASAMILNQGVAGSVTIENLTATSAMFVQATLGTLVLKGDDGDYYEVTVTADGVLHTEQVEPTYAEIEAGEMANGRKIVETEADIAELNAGNIRAQSAVVAEIFTTALTAEKISASEAFVASAVIPDLYVSVIRAIGDTLDMSANESVNIIVGNAVDDAVRELANETMATINALVVGGQNMINESELITITGTSSASTSFKKLASGLKPGTTYTLSMASAIKMDGTAAGMTLEAVRSSDSTVLFTDTLDFSGGHQKHTFTTALGGSEYELRLYAGIKGSGSGVVVQITKAKLEEGTFATMWNESQTDAEARLATLVSQLSATSTGLENIVSHVTNDLDGTVRNVNTYFRFDGSDPNNPKLILGSTESPMTMELTNSRLSFLWHGDPVAYFSDNKLYVTNVEAIERLSVGTPANGYLDIVTTATGVGFLWRN